MKNSLSPIRDCRRSDLPQVADLFVDTFPLGWHSSVEALVAYFEDVYFGHPWCGEEFPSLVFEQNGVISGFVGVVPRRMNFNGESIRVCVPSALMVRQDDRGRRNPIVAIGLLRRMLDGGQDLTLTDTANDLSRSLFVSCGATVAYPYNYSWLRPLRPFCAGLEVGSRVLPQIVPKLVKPFARLADVVNSAMPFNPFKVKKHANFLIEDMTPAMQLDAMAALPNCSLMPSYDLSSLKWLMKMAQHSVTEGKLSRRIVRDADGRFKGWFIYYQNRKSVGRVLQFVSTRQSTQDVFDCLLYDAQAAGLAALWGRTDPLNPEIANHNRSIFLSKPMVLVHSKREEIIRTILAGQMLFSGLEGESWMAVNAWS